MRGFVVSLALFVLTPALAYANDPCADLDRDACCPVQEPAEPTDTQRITAGVAGGSLLGLLMLGTAFHAARRLEDH